MDSVAESAEEKSQSAFFGSFQTGDLTGDSTIESASWRASNWALTELWTH